MFNEPRATSHESCNYSILESIKDGTAVSSKYNNDVMRFKIPNVVVVFSNHMPNTRELSKDLWKIFWIVNAGFNDTTIQVWKTQDGNKTFEGNLKKENDGDDECNEDNDLYIIVYICLNCMLEYRKTLKFQIFDAQKLY